MNEERKRELAETPVTLDGKPAKIFGTKRQFATVAQMPNGPNFQYAWTTVEYIILKRDGNFLS